MEFCENVMVSGDYYHHQQEQLLGAPPISSLEDLFSSQNTEVDMSLEWLSVFVEDCFSSSGNCLHVPGNQPPKTNIQTPENTTSKEDKPPKNPPTYSKKFEIPVKGRSKRKRITRIRSQLTSWSSEDPPLLQQTHWLADSELMTPKEMHGSTDTSQPDNLVVSEGCFPMSKQSPVVSLLYPRFSEKMAKPGIKSEKSIHVQVESVSSEKSDQALQEGEEKGAVVRKCSHCQSMKTPQWRAGPMGPKTLCNACGVRYKSGRLFPEYRPAKSPTFVSCLHSNSHKKVLEMRLALNG